MGIVVIVNDYKLLSAAPFRRLDNYETFAIPQAQYSLTYTSSVHSICGQSKGISGYAASQTSI